MTKTTGLLEKKQDVIKPTAFSADHEQCRRLAEVIKGVSFRSEFLRRPFVNNELSPELQGRMLFYAVGICHQTHLLADPGRNLYGWDYLEDGFLRMFRESSPLSDQETITRLSETEMETLLRPWFSPGNNPEQCTLDRLPERIRLWKNMAERLQHLSRGSLLHLLDIDHQGTLTASEYYHLLESFEAYSDPFHKKSSFLLKLLGDSGLFSVHDPENLVPVLDYHMMRVLLRSGGIAIHRQEDHTMLQAKMIFPGEPAVREAGIDAMKRIAQQSGVDVLRLNDIFYMLGRSCCLEPPLCVAGTCSKNPCSLTLTLHLQSHDYCLLDRVCVGKTDESFRSLWQPVTETHYY